MSQQRILVASERPDLFQATLQAEGYQLVFARSFEETATLIADRALDLVILDKLGDRDSLKAAKDLRSLGARLPTLVLVYPPAQLEAQLAAQGTGPARMANDFLVEGFSSAELRMRVRSQLEVHGLDREVFRMRDSFQDMLMYDLRAPLSSITVGLEYLDTLEGMPAGSKKVVSTIDHNCTDMDLALQNFLDLERREEEGFKLNRTDVVPRDLLEKCVVELKPTLAVRRVGLECTGAARKIRGDEAWLKRLLQGLTLSAGKLSAPDSPVVLDCKDEEGAVKLSASYRGQPIPTEARKKIFDRYFHREKGGWIFPRGVGLSLAMARKVAEAHMGRIWVDAPEEDGAVFCVLLPNA